MKEKKKMKKNEKSNGHMKRTYNNQHRPYGTHWHDMKKKIYNLYMRMKKY